MSCQTTDNQGYTGIFFVCYYPLSKKESWVKTHDPCLHVTKKRSTEIFFLSLFKAIGFVTFLPSLFVCVLVFKKKSNRIVVSCHIAQWCELKVGLNFKSSHEDCYAYMASGIIKCRSSWAVTKQFLMQLCQTSYLMTSL